MDIQPEFNINPLDQNLILKVVLEHVGNANADDLLSCRLVNHSWNKIASVLLRQHGCVLDLNFTSLLELKSLVLNTNLSREQSTRPAAAELDTLELSLSLCPSNYSDHCTEIAGATQFLVLHPHLRVSSLELDYNNYWDDEPDKHPPASVLEDHEMFSLFKTIAPTLAKLKLSNLSFKRQQPQLEEFNFDSYLELEFPKLTNIHYEVSIDFPGYLVDIPNLTKHVLALVKRSPKLNKMKLVLNEGSEEASASSFRTMMQDCGPQLVELHIDDGANPLLPAVLSETKFPLLKVFKMKNGDCNFANELNHFLKLNCPSLETYGLEWDDVENSGFSEEEDFPLEFPTLPSVKHFEFYPFYCEEATAQYLEETRLTFVTIVQSLPSVQLMSIDLGLLFTLGACLKSAGAPTPPPAAVFPILSNVQTLRVYIMERPTEQMLSLTRWAGEIYHHTFPNIQKLVIKPYSKDRHSMLKSPPESESYARLLQAIQFIITFHPGIQSIEVHDYPADWLFQIMRANPGLEGLKGLSFMKNSGKIGLSWIVEEADQLNLMELCICFPALQSFQYWSQMISSAELEAIRTTIKTITRFKSFHSKTFPRLLHSN